MRSPVRLGSRHSNVPPDAVGPSETSEKGPVGRSSERRDTPPRRSRLPVRLRLTMLYGGTLFLVGGLLLAIVSTLSAQTIREGGDPPFSLGPGSTVQLTGPPCPGQDAARSGPPAADPVDTCASRSREPVLDGLRRTSAVALLGLAVLASAFGYVMAGRVLAPVGRITGAARRRAHLHDPHPVSSAPETPARRP
ncbi:hypothetical protein ACF09E_13065 [Streptomyces sp. NPDC014891]|uniref:hypothetical protein n=1 Tax=Streptomyces sp. NPDC014891 TaxID=3364929 RepID=UPI00370307E6